MTLLALSVVGLSTFALSGCTPGSSVAAPGASPSVTDTAAPSPALVTDPAQAFDGDCSGVLTNDDVSAALDVGMVIAARTSPATPMDAAVAAVGGMPCDWAQDDSAAAATLSAVLLPEAFSSEFESTEPACYASSDESSTDPQAIRAACSFNLTASGFWLSGVVYPPAGSTEAAARSAITRLAERFSANTAAAAAFTPSAALDAAWPDDVDCAALGASAPVAAALPGWNAAKGNRPGERPEGYLRAEAAAGATTCLWSPPADGAGELAAFETQWLPGGAWAQDGLAPGTELRIDGVQRAVLVGTGADALAQVFDGPNWLEISYYGTSDPAPESYAPVAAALIQALNAAALG